MAVLTGLLIVGMVLLVVGMLRTADEMAGGARELRVEVPPGHRLEDASLSGDRLLLRLRTEEGTARLLVIDLESGRRLRDVILAPGP